MAFRVRMRVSVPKSIYDVQAAVNAMEHTARTKSIPDIQKLFRQTVNGWSEPPAFVGRVVRFSRSIRIVVEPSGQGTTNYIRVSRGTKAHTITAKRPGGFLAFRSGYRSATRPGSLNSSSPSRFGNYVRTYYVNHPGAEPREFDKQIAEYYEPTYVKDMQAAIEKGRP